MQQTISIGSVIDCSLVISADEFKFLYFPGIELNGVNGYKITNEVIENGIKTMITMLENKLDIKIAKKQLFEKYDYDRKIFNNWGYIKAFYNINEVVELKAKMSDMLLMDIPIDILSYNNEQPDQFRQIYIVPAQLMSILRMSGLNYLIFANDYIPNLLQVKYYTGFDSIPLDLLSCVCKYVQEEIFALLGNILQPTGITSSSKSIDGVSQNLSTTRSGSTMLFGANIDHINKQLEKKELDLIAKYKGFSMVFI